MKNIIKMSLVAAVAVAGLSSNAAAKPLEEAIKDVDLSGSMVYRYNDYKNDVIGSKRGTQQNNYKIGATLKSKVNDMVTANVRVVTGTGLSDSNASFAALDTSNNADANPTVQVSNASFTLKTDYATVIAGKQGLTTPWTVAVDSDSNEQNGTGLLALIPAGPVTIAAAYFNQTNLDNALSSSDNADAWNAANPLGVVDYATSTAYAAAVAADNAENARTGALDVMTIGVMGAFGPVSFDAWYLDMQDAFDTYSVGAKTKLDMITAEARYVSLDLDDSTVKNALAYVKLSTKIDVVNAYVNYGQTAKQGGLVALDSDAKNSMTGWSTNIHAKKNADYLQLGAGVDVLEGLNVALKYNDLEYSDGPDDVEESEFYTEITYNMSKNLKTYIRYGQYDQETTAAGVTTTDNDDMRGRLQIEYKF